MRSTAMVMTLLAALLAAAPAAADASADGGDREASAGSRLAPESWLGWLSSALAAQDPEGFTSTAPAEAAGPSVGQYRIQAGFRLWILARDLQTTHTAGRPKQWSALWNNEQTDRDAEWFIVQRVGAIRIGGDYVLMKEITLSGGILLGATASTLEWRVGPGNDCAVSTSDASMTIDTEVGWYPVDMYYGIEAEGRYAMQDFFFGARLQVQVSSAPFDSAGMSYGIVEGWITTFTNDLDLFAGYKTPYGTPRGGLGISIYECWSHQEEVADPTPADYKFHFREAQWIKVFLGYRYETKDKFYFGVEFSIIAQWCFGLEIGYQVM
ncbi:MAG: hypothetical protein MUC63_04710 [Planctomycetes bacterium]|jgi:hypothetical protein|nr:hypothetical protein [Planctomycetota bacterium]